MSQVPAGHVRRPAMCDPAAPVAETTCSTSKYIIITTYKGKGVASGWMDGAEFTFPQASPTGWRTPYPPRLRKGQEEEKEKRKKKERKVGAACPGPGAPCRGSSSIVSRLPLPLAHDSKQGTRSFPLQEGLASDSIFSRPVENIIRVCQHLDLARAFQD